MVNNNNHSEIKLMFVLFSLAEIFQDDSIPDPEQELDLELLGLRLDLVCMTLPKQLESLTENFAYLRSTSLCSSASYNRDSSSFTEEDPVENASIEEDLHSGSDVLSHLPSYQHWAVINVLDEMKWMLRDEIAFALTKTPEMTSGTLEFVRNHVQGSVGKSGSSVETVDLNFVFGNLIAANHSPLFLPTIDQSQEPSRVWTSSRRTSCSWRCPASS